MQDFANTLGEPTLHLAGLRLWVHGRQFPDADDYWDGNWIDVTVHCSAPGASIWVHGPIIHLSEITRFVPAVEVLYATLEGEATLQCMEPAFAVILQAENLGHFTMVVNITPDHLTQAHRFTFTLDQTYLPALIAGCRTLLQQYPMRGQPS